MSDTAVRKIVRVLKALVTITLACNLLALLLVPGLAYYHFDLEHIRAFWAYERDDCLWAFVSMIVLWWRVGEPYSIAMTLFLLFSGVCTAVILWQGRRMLDTVLRGAPFSVQNALRLRRAAACAFLIAAAAVLRTVWGLWFYQSLRPLATYNALFVPVFAVFGLLCLVMSALVRQAAEMQAENDLTI